MERDPEYQISNFIENSSRILLITSIKPESNLLFPIPSCPSTTIVGVSLPVIVHHIYTRGLIYTFTEWSRSPRVLIDINLAVFNIRCCGLLRGSGFVPVANQLRQLPWALHKLVGVSLNNDGSDRSFVACSVRRSGWTRIVSISICGPFY